MQKVVGVNLNGNAYQVEEDAYGALQAYLERAQARLAKDPDRDEILADLEQAIADKCAAVMRPHKSVVTGVEMNRLLDEMGPVDAGDADTVHANGPAPSDEVPPKEPTAARKRLYQIREGSMISGVCNGIAAYLNVDVTIVRVIFVLLAVVTKGVFLVVYGAMMLVIPYAETSEQHAEASGRPFTAQELIDQAKRNYANFRSNKDWKRQWRQQRRAWRHQWRYNLRRNTWHAYAVYPTEVATGTAAPVLGLLHAALALALVLALISLATTHAVFGYPVPAGIPYWAAFLIVIFIYQAIASPLLAARYAAYGPSVGPPLAWLEPIFGLLWLAFVAFSVWWGYHHVPAVHDFILSLPGWWDRFVADLKRA